MYVVTRIYFESVIVSKSERKRDTCLCQTAHIVNECHDAPSIICILSLIRL